MEQSKPEEVATPAPEAAPAAPSAPAAKPGPTKKTWMIVAIVAVVAVVVIAAIVLGTGMLNSDDGDDGGDGGNGGAITSWEPQSGDYHRVYHGHVHGEMVMKQTYKEITATTITINTTTTMDRVPTEYDEETITNDTDLWWYGLDIDDPPDGYNVVDKGTPSVSAPKWGTKSAKHYRGIVH